MATSTQSPPNSAAAPLATTQRAGFGTGFAARIPRALRPSLSDCFFAALICWLFIFGASGWKALLGDGDTGWHIRAGQYILAHHAVPTQDLFSFSRPLAPWFAWEWLTDVLYAALFQWSGLKAIVLVTGVLIGLFGTIVLRYTIWRGANPLIALFTTLFAIGASSMHFLARPHIFTLLLVPVYFWMLEADRRRNTRWLWILIPLTALWTNLHGGFMIALACMAVLIAGTAIEAWQGLAEWSAVRRYGVLLGACSLASLINPYGVRLHEHIIEYLRADWIKNLVQEFQSPTFRSEGQLQYEALLIAGLVVAGFLLTKRRFTEALWILFLAHASLISVRHAPIYATVAAPFIACELSQWWSTAAARLKKSQALRILHQLGSDLSPGFRRTSVWPAVFICVLMLLNKPLHWPSDFPAELFPIEMVHRHADLITSGRLLTTDQWGDYIIYTFYPRQKVFVDGRSDFYGEDFAGQYVHLLQGAYDWREIMRRYGFTVALLPANWPLASLLKQDSSWRVIADDQHAVLLRRIGQ
ncbi:MAG TPA: hypothetical protein VME17_05800 [Bryobacteraceae bacterium]|nr:hypothetical protein [Bryobacteraceae bacterium]